MTCRNVEHLRDPKPDPPPSPGGYAEAVRSLGLMHADALATARTVEASRRHSVEAAYHRGQAEAFDVALRLIMRHFG